MIRSPDLAECRFGTQPTSLQRLLHLLMQCGHLLFACAGWDRHRTAEVATGARKRLGDDHAVPGVQDPGAVNGDVEAANGLAALFGEHDWSRLGYVARAAWAIDGEHSSITFFQFAAHAHERADCPTGTRPTHRAITKPLHDAGDVLTIEAAADHQRHLAPAKTIAGRDNASVPKAPDSASGPAVGEASFFADYVEAQRGA